MTFSSIGSGVKQRIERWDNMQSKVEDVYFFSDIKFPHTTALKFAVFYTTRLKITLFFFVHAVKSARLFTTQKEK